MSPFHLAKNRGTTSCYRKRLLLSRLPLVIETASCIETTSCYRDYLLLSETPLIIETTSCYRKHLLLSRLPLVIETTSCYRDYLLSSRRPLVIRNTSCYREHFLLSKGIFVRLGVSYYVKFDQRFHGVLSFHVPASQDVRLIFSTKDKLPISLVTFAFHQFNKHT